MNTLTVVKIMLATDEWVMNSTYPIRITHEPSGCYFYKDTSGIVFRGESGVQVFQAMFSYPLISFLAKRCQAAAEIRGNPRMKAFLKTLNLNTGSQPQ